MKDKHIVDILENAPLAGLTESEMILIRTHVKGCAACQRAYEAAQLGENSRQSSERLRWVACGNRRGRLFLRWL